MKNNPAEALPSAPQENEPERLFTPADAEEVLSALESDEERKEQRERRAAAVQEMIGGTLEDLEKGEKEKEKPHRVEKGGIVYEEAAKAAGEVVDKHLKTAIQMMEADPAVAVMTLLTPINEHLRMALDPEGGFAKLHEDPLKQQMYDIFARRLHHEAASAVKTALENRGKAIAATIEKMEASDKSRALGAEGRHIEQLVALIDEEDRKGLQIEGETAPERPTDAAPEETKSEKAASSTSAKKRWYQVWKK
jgi:hypothetical protein